MRAKYILKIYVFVSAHVLVCVYVFPRECVCVCVRVYVRVCARACFCAYVQLYVDRRKYMCGCVHMHAGVRERVYNTSINMFVCVFMYVFHGYIYICGGRVVYAQGCSVPW